MLSGKDLSTTIKKLAIKNGFNACGISSVRELKQESEYLQQWLDKDYEGSMNYMKNNTDKRKDPGKLVEGAKSVISVLKNYYPGKNYRLKSNYKISKYALGKDYHSVIKDQLRMMADEITEICGEFSYRVFTDSAPVFDKAWAQIAGLGWIGKNSILINKKSGSFFFIGHIICDLKLEADKVSEMNHCGNCTRCIDACPNNAITEPYIIDARKCITYLTTVLKEKTTESLKGKTQSWIFGCDICQDVCPWNESIIPHDEPDFIPQEELLEMNDKDWETLSKEKFTLLFEGTPIERTAYENLMKNINAAETSI